VNMFLSHIFIWFHTKANSLYYTWYISTTAPKNTRLRLSNVFGGTKSTIAYSFEKRLCTSAIVVQELLGAS
jgi:hypothetical protein